MKQIQVRFKNGGRYQPALGDDLIEKISQQCELYEASRNKIIKSIIASQLAMYGEGEPWIPIEESLLIGALKENKRPAVKIREILEEYFELKHGRRRRHD